MAQWVESISYKSGRLWYFFLLPSGLVTKLCPTLVTPCTVAHQAPLTVGFSKQESWSGLPFPSPGDLPGPGIEPRSPALQADSLPIELPGKPHPISNPLPSPITVPARRLSNQSPLLQQYFEDTLSLSLASTAYEKSPIRATIFAAKLSFPLIVFEVFLCIHEPKSGFVFI